MNEQRAKVLGEWIEELEKERALALRTVNGLESSNEEIEIKLAVLKFANEGYMGEVKSKLVEELRIGELALKRTTEKLESIDSLITLVNHEQLKIMPPRS